MKGSDDYNIGISEAQGQPPYYPPSQPPPYGQPPYQQSYPPQGYGPAPYPMQPRPVEPTNKPMIAGILLIVFGLINIGYSIYSATIVDTTLDQVGNLGELDADFIRNIALASIAISIVFSVAAIIGGYFATQKTKFTLVMICGILGVLSGGPVCVSGITAIIALILVYTSKDEFNGSKTPRGPPPYTGGPPLGGPPPVTGPPPMQPPGY